MVPPPSGPRRGGGARASTPLGPSAPPRGMSFAGQGVFQEHEESNPHTGHQSCSFFLDGWCNEALIHRAGRLRSQLPHAPVNPPHQEALAGHVEHIVHYEQYEQAVHETLVFSYDVGGDGRDIPFKSGPPEVKGG